MIREVQPDYTIVYLPHAEKEFLALPSQIQKRIDTKILSLRYNPRPHGAIEFKGGSGVYRLRVGDYRVIYEIRDKRLIVLIIQIGHRREIYKKRRK